MSCEKAVFYSSVNVISFARCHVIVVIITIIGGSGGGGEEKYYSCAVFSLVCSLLLLSVGQNSELKYYWSQSTLSELTCCDDLSTQLYIVK